MRKPPRRKICSTSSSKATAVGARKYGIARAVQKAAGGEPVGLKTQVAPITTSPFSPGTDDIGDVSWVVPTVQLRYPANLVNLPGHHWSNAMTMATPIAHKGVIAGAKVVAATVLDLLLKPELISETKRYFTEVQTKDKQYEPFIGPFSSSGKASENTVPLRTSRAEVATFSGVM